uniref:DUF4806 domain-containing protein n=2 Tax=Schistocephalus solidus TaxID=70667 RepID=A0A0X3PYR9_SCHSO
MRERKSHTIKNAPLANESNRIPLPLRTVEAYEDFTQRLAADDDVFMRTAKQLALVGGQSPKEYIRKVMSNLLGPPLCTQFTWSRARTKKRFVSSPLFAVFHESIKLNALCRNCSREGLEKIAMEWFHGTRDRYGGRTKRRQAARYVSTGSSNTSSCPSPTLSDNTIHVPVTREKYAEPRMKASLQRKSPSL